MSKEIFYAQEISEKSNLKFLISEELKDSSNRHLYAYEVSTDIYGLPIFSKVFCDSVIRIAENSNKWGKERHESYKTNDIQLDVLGIDDFMNSCIKFLLMPIFDKIWSIGQDLDFSAENFIIKYELENQRMLHLHHDDSDITVNINLNNQYEGGEVYFPRQKSKIDNKNVGHGLIHPGKITHIHGSLPIFFGVRYRLVSFIKFKD